MPNHTEAAPMLPPASVDFNELHRQMRAGADASTAIEAAIIPDTLAEPDGGEALLAGGGDTDALDGMLKADLQARARDLGIAFESDANKDALKTLLRAHPEGVPVEPLSPGVIADQSAGSNAEPAA